MPGIVLGFGDMGMKKTKKSQPSWSLHSVGPTDNRQAKGTEWVRVELRRKNKRAREEGVYWTFRDSGPHQETSPGRGSFEPLTHREEGVTAPGERASASVRRRTGLAWRNLLNIGKQALLADIHPERQPLFYLASFLYRSRSCWWWEDPIECQYTGSCASVWARHWEWLKVFLFK